MKQRKVLIVEDEAIVAADLASKLVHLGCRVVGNVARGEDAVIVAGEQRPDIVLMDVRLSGAIDGIEAAQRIRSVHDIPVVYLTAHSDPETLSRALGTEPFGYVLKPFEDRDLQTQIEVGLYKHQTQVLLRENEERLRLAAEAAHFGTYDFNLDKDVIVGSPQLFRICGLCDDELLTSQRVIELIVAEDLDRVRALALQILSAENDGQFEIECRIRHKYGEVCWILVRGRRYLGDGEQGCLVRILGTVVDLTQRKATEEQLGRQNDRLKLLAKTAELLLTADDPSGMMNDVFAAVQQHLNLDGYVNYRTDENGSALVLEAFAGIPLEVLQLSKRLEFGESLSGIVAQTRATMITEELQESDDPSAALAKQAGFLAYACHPLIVGDRILGTLAFASKHRQRFEAEEIEFMRTVSQYVAMAKERLRLLAETRQTAQRFAKNELRLQLALDTADVGIYDLDLQSVQTMWDDRLRAHWGLKAGAPINYDQFIQAIHPDDREAAQAAMDQALDSRGVGKFDADFRVIGIEDGIERWISSRGQIFYEGGSPLQLFGTTCDFTERKRSEVERAQLAAIVESSEDAIISTDLAGNVTSWNRGAARMYGYDATEVIGRPVSALMPDERHDAEMAVIGRIAQGEAIDHYETLLRRKDGRLIDISMAVSPIKDGQGGIIGASKIAHDITARKMAEEALWRSDEQLRLAQGAAHVGIWDWDPRNDNLHWTPEMLNLYGLSQPVTNYRDWRQLVHVDDIERIEAERAQAIRLRQTFNVEYRVLHGAGEVRWIASRGQGWFNDQGELIRVLGINMDITERKRIEEALRESEERFKALADSAPVLIWIMGPEGARFFNQAYRDFVGVNDDSELIGFEWTRYLHPDDRDEYLAHYLRSVERRMPFEADCRFRRVDGQFRWMKTLATPRFADRNAFVGYAGCTIDIHDRKLAETQSALLAAVVNSSQDAIYSFTLDEKVLSWNDAAETLFGWTEAEVLGQSCSLFLPPELSDEHEIVMSKIGRGESVTQYETLLLRKDGGRFDAALVLSPVIVHGVILGVSAIARDISDIKRTKEQREQQARLLDLSLDAIIVWHFATGAIEYWNQGAERLYGYSAADAAGYSSHKLLRTLYPVSQSDVQRKITAEGEWGGRLIHTKKDGGRVAVMSRMQRVVRPHGDMVLEVNRDITVVEEAEQAAAEAAAHLKAVVETAVDGIITIDENGSIESVNPAVERIFGYDAGDMIGREIGLLMPDLSGAAREQLANYVKSHEYHELGSGAETRGRRKDGSEFIIEFGISETILGNTRFFTSLVRDATSRKENERALIEAKNSADAANRAKTEFLANMSHEIRNPMTGIMGYADILLGRLEDDKDIGYVRTIKDSGQYLLQIINDLLDLAKIEAQGLDLKQEEIRLPNFFTDVFTLMQGAARGKSLPLSLRYDGVIPYKIESDSKRLRQILINLLSNAIKFTQEGAVELAVQFSADSSELRFQVSDSGIGISEEQQRNLYRPFTQGDSSTSKSYGGTGLGLAITKRLIEGLGGIINVKSSPGIGSTFRVTLPVKVLSTDSYQTESKSPLVPILGNRMLDARVMIVEDQSDIRRLIEHFITKEGGTVTVFDRGDAALKEIQERPDDYDIILMDIQMPGPDGNETTRRMRALGFSKPIIAVTAGAMADDQASCRAAGCSDYISKPIDMAKLLDLVARFVTSHRPSARVDPRPRLDRSNHNNHQPESPPSILEADKRGQRARQRILLVDDRPVPLNATKILLEGQGFKVRTATSGGGAVRAALEFQPDFVFLDIGLPDISGYDVLRQLKSAESLSHTRFIALSGYGFEECARAQQAGFDNYMTKPVDIDEIEKLIGGSMSTFAVK